MKLCLIALLTGLQFVSAASAQERPILPAVPKIEKPADVQLLEAEKKLLQAQNIYLQAQLMLIKAEQEYEALKKSQAEKHEAKKEKD